MVRTASNSRTNSASKFQSRGQFHSKPKPSSLHIAVTVKFFASSSRYFVSSRKVLDSRLVKKNCPFCLFEHKNNITKPQIPTTSLEKAKSSISKLRILKRPKLPGLNSYTVTRNPIQARRPIQMRRESRAMAQQIQRPTKSKVRQGTIFISNTPK